jgi:hypothetical protein
MIGVHSDIVPASVAVPVLARGIMSGRAGFVAVKVLAFVIPFCAICTSALADQAILKMQPELGDEYEFAAVVDNESVSGSSNITAAAILWVVSAGDRRILAWLVQRPRPGRGSRAFSAAVLSGLGMVIYKIDGGC